MIMDFACQGDGLIQVYLLSLCSRVPAAFLSERLSAEGEIIQIFCVYAREKEREKRDRQLP